MKIAAISPNPAHLNELRTVLEGQAHNVLLYEGGKSRMEEVAAREEPDMMLVDGICCDPHELTHVEQVTSTHPACAVVLMCSTHTPEFLLNSMRAGVREVLPSPAPRDALLAAIERVASKLRGTAARRGRTIAFTSCKGGSGATFLATNVAWQLADGGSSVLLVDLNLQFGDALSFLHDGNAPATLADVAKEIGRLDASLLSASTVKVAPNLSVLAAPEDLAQAMEVKPEHVDAILDLAAGQYDFVVVDVARNLDPVAIKAFDRAWRIFPVIQLGLPGLRNAGRLLEAFRALSYASEKVEVVVNRHERGGDLSLEHLQKTLGGSRIHTVPNAWRDVDASINHGDPVVKSSRGSAVSRQLGEFARTLSPRQEETRGLLGRLFRKASA